MDELKILPITPPRCDSSKGCTATPTRMITDDMGRSYGIYCPEHALEELAALNKGRE